MRPSLPRLVFLTLIALLLTVTSGAQAQTPTPLPPLSGDDQSSASCINDRGQVFGHSILGNRFTGVVWDEHGTPRRLRPLIGDTGATVGGLNSCNNNGEVAGRSISSSGSGTPVFWDRNGTPTALPGFSAISISNSGLILGSSLSARTTLWDKKGRTLLLRNEVGEEPVSVNTRGDVLLNHALTATRSTFVLRRDGSASFCDETGNAMNDKGEVVGFARTLAASATVPFLCDSKKRTFMTLPCRSGPVQFGDGGSAGGINQFSEVVGSCSPDGEPTTAVVWDQGRNPTALPPLAGQNCGAIGINKRGVIVRGCRDVSSGMLTGVVWKWCGGDSRRCR